MAQTKKKRRSKHRGTAAGTVESRGRTGRKPSGDERRPDRAGAARGRQDRFSKPPSWRSAANRALIATAIFLVAVVALFRQPIGAAVSLAAFMFLIYIPLGYYTDSFLYNRRQRQLQGGGKGGR